jgi:hypothetical protein
MYNVYELNEICWVLCTLHRSEKHSSPQSTNEIGEKHTKLIHKMRNHDEVHSITKAHLFGLATLCMSQNILFL